MFEIVAHRGAPELAPENTLPAFHQALALGADAIELDVRLTGDGVPVVFHYFYLDELTPVHGPIFQLTWNELRGISVTKPGFMETKIPSLDETLDALAGRIGLEIEIKGPEPGCIEAIVSVLNNHPGALEKLEITSYETSLLKRFHRLQPDTPVDLLIPLSEPWMKADVLAYTALQRGRLAEARAVHLHASQLSDDTVNAIREGGCQVHAWGINHLPALQTAANLQIRRICTDDLRQAIQFREAVKI